MARLDAGSISVHRLNTQLRRGAGCYDKLPPFVFILFRAIKYKCRSSLLVPAQLHCICAVQPDAARRLRQTSDAIASTASWIACWVAARLWHLRCCSSHRPPCRLQPGTGSASRAQGELVCAPHELVASPATKRGHPHLQGHVGGVGGAPEIAIAKAKKDRTCKLGTWSLQSRRSTVWTQRQSPVRHNTAAFGQIIGWHRSLRLNFLCGAAFRSPQPSGVR
jgi:hypothetical protein